MRRLIAAIAIMPSLAVAEDWTSIRDDAGVTAALADRVLVYDAYTVQTFHASGETLYVTERSSQGRWAARGGQYCSVWPPSDTWACYDLETSGDRVRFIASDRSVSEGTYAE